MRREKTRVRGRVATPSWKSAVGAKPSRRVIEIWDEAQSAVSSGTLARNDTCYNSDTRERKIHTPLACISRACLFSAERRSFWFPRSSRSWIRSFTLSKSNFRIGQTRSDVINGVMKIRAIFFHVDMCIFRCRLTGDFFIYMIMRAKATGE